MAANATGASYGPFEDEVRATHAAPALGSRTGGREASAGRSVARTEVLPWGALQRRASVAVYGALGLEGRELVRSLLEAGHPPTLLRLFDDEPRALSFRDRPLLVRQSPGAGVATNLAFVAQRGPRGRSLRAALVDAGVRVVDLGGDTAPDPELVLLAPGLGEGAVGAFTQAVRVPRGPLGWLAPILARLDAAAGLREVSAAWLAPAAAEGLEVFLKRRAGGGAADALGVEAAPAVAASFDPRRLRQLLDAPRLGVELSALRGSALRADVVQVFVRTERDLEQEPARRAMSQAAGVRLLGPEEEARGGPTAARLEGRVGVEVTRLRAGVRGAGSVSFLAVGDHLLAGAVRSAMAAASLLPLG